MRSSTYQFRPPDDAPTVGGHQKSEDARQRVWEHCGLYTAHEAPGMISIDRQRTERVDAFLHGFRRA